MAFFKSKMNKFRFRLWFRPRPRWES